MNHFTTRATLWVNRGLAVLMAVMLFALPQVLRWFTELRPLGPAAIRAILIAFYACALAVFPALWELDVLLRNILGRLVFIGRNVSSIRRVRWCCVAVALICTPASIFYPPLAFMVIIMTFLALVTSVLGKVMAAAVEIREENDLTV